MMLRPVKVLSVLAMLVSAPLATGQPMATGRPLATGQQELTAFTKEGRSNSSGVAGRVSGSRGGSPLRSLLTKRISEPVVFDEAPLSDVFEWVRAQSGDMSTTINVVPRWRALSAESIDEDTPVKLTMEDATVAEILNEVLDQISDLDPVRYLGSGNTLKISTKSDFDRKLYTRIYDIEDIFFEVKNFFGSPQIDLSQQQQGGGGGGAGGVGGQVQSVFGQGGQGGGEDDNNENDEEDDERIEEIREWIVGTVEPDSWDDQGGLGALNVFNKQLIVHNTMTVHELLGGPFYLDE